MCSFLKNKASIITDTPIQLKPPPLGFSLSAFLQTATVGWVTAYLQRKVTLFDFTGHLYRAKK